MTAESDIHELLQAPKYANIHYIVRSKNDRKLADESTTMWESVGLEDACFSYKLEVPCQKNRNKQRVASMEVRYKQVRIKAGYRKAKNLKPVDLWIVEASEANPPAGEQALCWRLLTSVLVDSIEMAQKIVDYYVIRWVIERFHHTVKQGNRVEDLQIEDPEALKNAIILQSWCAIKVCALAYQNKQLPQTTLEQMGFSQQDYLIAYVYVKYKINRNLVKVENPTLRDFATLIAQIGGSNLQKNRPLATVSLWKGWTKFLIIKETWLLDKDVGNQ